MANLDDGAFTKECLDRSVANTGNNSDQQQPLAIMAPAIASLKSLEKLSLLYCPKLTNACVVNGIAHSRTLQKLEVRNCREITVECLQENMRSGQWTME